MTQAAALKALKLGHNIFLTGAAGSGKTFVLNKYIEYLKKKRIVVAVTASTGIAATHMNGITIHAWSGMGIRSELKEADFKIIARNPKVRRRLKSAKVLIIDEVSMLHAYQLDMVDAICRKFLIKSLPFGGLQVVLCGDFFQLPPIQKDQNKEVQFVFSSFAWRAANIQVCYLGEQHRQKNDELAGVLNGIRVGNVKTCDVEALKSRINAELPGWVSPTRLFSHNHDVNRVNDLEFAKLGGHARLYEMRSSGHEQLIETIKGGCLAPENLYLKIGAQVMFVKNNFEAGYVNGTTGVVEGFDEETKMPIVGTTSGQSLVAEPETWSIGDDDSILASVRQVPLRLAWAITIHKSQGMTLDSAEIDLAKAFEFGMGYVALSRVRTMAGLRLLGLNDLALEVNPDILAIDLELRQSSDCFRAQLDKIIEPKKIKVVKDKKPPKEKNPKVYTLDDKRDEHAKAYQPWTTLEDILLGEMFRQGLSVEVMSLQFKRNDGAINSRLNKLGLLK